MMGTERIQIYAHGYDTDKPITTSFNLDQPCSECLSIGVVDSLAWIEWRKRYDEISAQYISLKLPSGNTVSWFDSPQYQELESEQPNESEETACGECDGTGYTLTEQGRQLQAFVLRHCLGRGA